MKYSLPLFLLAVLAASLALPQSSTPAVKKGAPAPKTASAAAKKKGKTTKKTVAATTWRSRQMVPTPERYKEIQQALVDKGYLKSEANGIWDAQSEDALRQFQTDQKLSPTGKLSSASLIALGLGPKTSAGVNEPLPPITPPDTPPLVETPPPAATPRN